MVSLLSINFETINTILMKHSRRRFPEVNAGSMADIAFLLLIFFLVTAMIPNDKGIFRKLPELCPPGEICDSEINQRNIFEIRINANNELFVENEVTRLNDLRTLTKSFLDNNGDGTCVYCNGEKLATASDSPDTAVISLKNSPTTSYAFYIQVQDELTKAYYELREAYALQKFNKSEKELTKAELSEVKKAYPFKLSEAEME